MAPQEQKRGTQIIKPTTQLVQHNWYLSTGIKEDTLALTLYNDSVDIDNQGTHLSYVSCPGGTFFQEIPSGGTLAI